MTYTLARAFFILIAWAMTCVLIRNLWTAADPIIFGAVGAAWLIGGMAYFCYLQKLRRDIEELERRRYGFDRQHDFQPVEGPAAE